MSMVFTIQGEDGCVADDGISIKLNGVSVADNISLFGGSSFGPYTADIEFNDIIDIYNYDTNSGYCWGAGTLHLIFVYNDTKWGYDYSSGYGYCRGQEPPSCQTGWTPSQYPAKILSFRLTSRGPVRIDSRKYDCQDYTSSESSSNSSGFNSSFSSSSSSASTSSAVFPTYGVTYYSEFNDSRSINNPIVGNDAEMQFSGFWDKGYKPLNYNLENFNNGLNKTRNNKGMIFSNKTSKLFSSQGGYIGMSLSFSMDIINGVHRLLKNDNSDINEMILFGINMGRYEFHQPSMYAALTSRGIEFRVFTSEGDMTLVDDVTNLRANNSAFFEFAWGRVSSMPREKAMIMRINGGEFLVSNPPIGSDYVGDFQLCFLDTPFNASNLECSIKKLVIYSEIPKWLLQEIDNSSSSSSSDSTDGLAYSESSSSSSAPMWNFTRRIPAIARYNHGVASSADGVKLVAVNWGQIFTSTNSGSSWSLKTSGIRYNSVTSSADGTKLVVAAHNDGIYVSNDSGATWQEKGVVRAWESIGGSTNGNVIVASCNEGEIWVSKDYGNTWSMTFTGYRSYAIACSADGSNIIVGGLYSRYNESVILSTDSGDTWIYAGSFNRQYVQAVASSADGSKLVIGVRDYYSVGGNIFTSINYGVTWTVRTTIPGVIGLASSADGVKLSACGYYGKVWTSEDSGVTWVPRSGVSQWMSVASSADGEKMIVGNSSDYVYTGVEVH